MITKRHTSAIGRFGTLEWFGWDGTEMVLLATIGGGPRMPHTQFKKALFTLFYDAITFSGKDASVYESPSPRTYVYVIRVPVKESTLATLTSTAGSIANALEETLAQLGAALAEVVRAPTNEDTPRAIGIC